MGRGRRERSRARRGDGGRRGGGRRRGGDDAAAVEALEVQAWLELDALSARLGYASVPLELLGLLPPPPAAGWPLEFAQVGARRAAPRASTSQGTRRHATVTCGSRAAHLPPSCTVHLSRHTRHKRHASLPSQARATFREGSRAELQESLDWPMELRTSARYTPTDSAYPALRRASRFSYAIWAVLAASADGVALQRVRVAADGAASDAIAIVRQRRESRRGHLCATTWSRLVRGIATCHARCMEVRASSHV